MNMENNIIKDRIQDVRERFLSGNQIEEIRQNVTSLVNERLDEFQNAQNNAFKELEVAIDKLENHQREMIAYFNKQLIALCLLYTSPSPRDLTTSRMPSSA